MILFLNIGLKKKSTIFYNLEMQTSFLNKITNMENFSDLKFKNAAESRLMKVLIFLINSL